MTFARNAMALAATGLLALACGGAKDGGSSAGTLDDVPAADALTLEVTGAAAEQAAAQPGPAAAAVLDAGVAAPTDWPVTGADLAEGQKKIAAVNAALRAFVEHIEDVAGTPGDKTAGGRWYGPADRCTVDVAQGDPCPADAVANLRLWIGRRGGALPGRAFVLQARPAGSTDGGAFVGVAAGWMVRGTAARRGHGQIWLDLDHLKAVAAGYHGQGRLLGGFSAGPMAKAETLLLRDFTPDTTNPDWPAATVAFRGFKNALGTARVRVAAIKDFVQTTSDTELGLAHIVYNAAVGGRAFAIVTNYTPAGGSTHGDVPAGKYFFGRSCYAAGAPNAPIFKEWFLCPLAEAPAACVADAGNPSTIEKGTSWSAQCTLAAAPAEFDPPQSSPGLNPDPAGAPSTMPGEASTGETPDDVPGDADAPAPS